jgi:hypothetical protein
MDSAESMVEAIARERFRRGGMRRTSDPFHRPPWADLKPTLSPRRKRIQ